MRLFRREILVLGDSHSYVFNQESLQKSFPKYVFRVVAVHGATVSGLENPNSKTQALPIFINHCKKSRAQTALVLLGEVDTGFVIWYRAEKYNTSVEQMLSKALENYQRFLKTLSERFRVICISAPLPTIQDGQDWGEVANARKDVKATQLQRTELTIQFNKLMQGYCEAHQIPYLSLDRETLGANGLVDDQLLNSDVTDHHYDMSKYANLITDKLNGLI